MVRKITLAFPVIFSLLFSVSPGYAEEPIQMAAGFSLSNKYSLFEISGFELDPDYTTANIDLIWFYGEMYLRLNYDRSIKDDTQNLGGGTHAVFSRQDAGATFGYNLSNRVSVFGGILAGNTEFPIFTSAGTDNFTHELSYVGPFAGTSYSYPLRKGSLSLSIAYTKMNGAFSIYDPANNDQATSHGTTDGLSYGIVWSRRVNEAMNFQMGYKVNRFEFNDDEVAVDGNDNSTKDNMNIFSIGFIVFFE
ncbi:MAG: hypothetical protein OEY67_04835 [Gammaproteobacteria bacterium]|nr:hypothetical protein [Gammaproteobacteria bacterium]